MKKTYELQIELGGEYSHLWEYQTKEELIKELTTYKEEDRIEGLEGIEYYCTERIDGEAVNFYQL